MNGPALERGLDIAATLKPGSTHGLRADALVALAPRLAPGTSERAVALALEDGYWAASSIARMAPFLTGRAYAMACSAVRGTADATDRAQALAALAAATDDDFLVLEALTAMADPRAHAITGIDKLGPAIAALEPPRRLEAIGAAVHTVDARPRQHVLHALAVLAPTVASLG
jgi:hypothetical protein